MEKGSKEVQKKFEEKKNSRRKFQTTEKSDGNRNFLGSTRNPERAMEQFLEIETIGELNEKAASEFDGSGSEDDQDSIVSDSSFSFQSEKEVQMEDMMVDLKALFEKSAGKITQYNPKTRQQVNEYPLMGEVISSFQKSFLNHFHTSIHPPFYVLGIGNIL